MKDRNNKRSHTCQKLSAFALFFLYNVAPFHAASDGLFNLLLHILRELLCAYKVSKKK